MTGTHENLARSSVDSICSICASAALTSGFCRPYATICSRVSSGTPGGRGP
ncbi:hypothetical protein [Nannocystis pusilla]|uniref:hypothetical protein n=1 Tax=Nannocystis pusilla TaxID=889268 RepID=UPI003DA48633